MLAEEIKKQLQMTLLWEIATAPLPDVRLRNGIAPSLQRHNNDWAEAQDMPDVESCPVFETYLIVGSISNTSTLSSFLMIAGGTREISSGKACLYIFSWRSCAPF